MLVAEFGERRMSTNRISQHLQYDKGHYLAAFNAMDDWHKEVLNHFIQTLDNAKVAERLKVSEAEIETRINAAHAQFLALLKKNR
jgi:hypothetical protein